MLFTKNRRRPVAALAAIALAAAALLPDAARAQAPAAPPSAAPSAVVAVDPAALTAAYAYAKPSSFAVKAETVSKPDDTLVRERIAFTDVHGETVPGILVRPKGAGPFPAVLLLHGLGGKKEDMADTFGVGLAQHGVACLALDAVRHGERKKPGETKPDLQPAEFVTLFHTTIVDYRQALDYLAARPDIDSRHIGLLGYSMGAMMGAILAGVDTRVRASVLCVGGDPLKPLVPTVPATLVAAAESICPSNFVGRISPRPVYIVNGKVDTVVTPEAAKRLQDAAKEPKTVVWVETGHVIGIEAAVAAGTWLLGKLSASAATAPAAPAR